VRAVRDEAPMFHYRIASPRKVFSGQKFTGKNPPRPAAARAGRIFADKLSARGGRSDLVMGRLYGAGDILIRERHITSVIIFFLADFSWGRHFNVTPALAQLAVN